MLRNHTLTESNCQKLVERCRNATSQPPVNGKLRESATPNRTLYRQDYAAQYGPP